MFRLFAERLMSDFEKMFNDIERSLLTNLVAYKVVQSGIRRDGTFLRGRYDRVSIHLGLRYVCSTPLHHVYVR